MVSPLLVPVPSVTPPAVDATAAAQAWALANGYTPPAAPSGPVLPAAVPYRTVSFLDEFGGTAFDPTKWEPIFWYAKLDSPGDIPNNNGGQADLSCISVANGLLTLTATSKTPGNPQSWLNGFLDTASFYATPRGGWYGQASIKGCGGQPGTWPAFVFYEDGEKASGLQYFELDPVEMINQPPGYHGQQAWQGIHPASGSYPSAQIGTLGIDLSSAFHTYGVMVDPAGNVTRFFDGQQNGPVQPVGQNALEPMFANVTMSTGGNAQDGWAGVPSPTGPSRYVMEVEYVGVWVA
jgi:hypothetical protein